MRKFLIYVEMNDDLSEYDLVCSIDGKEVRRKEEYSLGDCCIDLYDFERSICDDYMIDTRFDEFRIKFDIISC